MWIRHTGALTRPLCISGEKGQFPVILAWLGPASWSSSRGALFDGEYLLAHLLQAFKYHLDGTPSPAEGRAADQLLTRLRSQFNTLTRITPEPFALQSPKCGVLLGTGGQTSANAAS